MYTILDKTMLGWFSGENKSQNGYYEYATGFVNMAKILIMSFNAVMSARMSYLFGNGRIEEVHERIRDSLDFVLLMAMPIMLGLAGIAAQFIPLVFGKWLSAGYIFDVCVQSAGTGCGIKRLYWQPDLNARRKTCPEW